MWPQADMGYWTMSTFGRGGPRLNHGRGHGLAYFSVSMAKSQWTVYNAPLHASAALSTNLLAFTMRQIKAMSDLNFSLIYLLVFLELTQSPIILVVVMGPLGPPPLH